MNLSGQSAIGRILRLPLRLIPKDAVMPVLRGPLKGAKWIVGSHTHGCWLGTYEREKQELFASFVKPDSVVYDVGANVGFYSLLAAKRGARLVVACEPDPENASVLRQHVELNHLGNVTIEPVAICDREGIENFAAAGPQGRLGDDGYAVRTTTVDSLLAHHPHPTLIKIDVEGAEWRVLQGCDKALDHHPAVFVAFDDPRRTREKGIEWMAQHGYRYSEILGPNELLFS